MSLLLLIPAIMVPVVLLASFAACARVFGLYHVDPPPLMIESATGKDAVTITLVWEGDDTMQKYQFHRTNPDGTTTDFDVPVPAAPFDDTGLLPASNYTYQVREFDQSGDPSELSAPVTGMTRPMTSAYATILTDDSPGWEGYSLVQRIEATQLGATGPHVRITLQASPAGDASIDRLYISQVNSSGKPYDSAADLTVVYDLAANGQQPFVVPAGTARQLPIVGYTINRIQALLIAIDFSASPTSVVIVANVPTSEATAYSLATSGGEAASKTRSPNYREILSGATSAVILITNIEVG